MNHLTGIFISLTIIILIVGSEAVGHLPPCNEIINQLSPCVPFLTKDVASPSQTCCNGVRYLANYAGDKEDRITICRCIESSESMFPLVDYSLLSSLPKSCGVPIKLPPITPSFDCSNA